MFLRNHGSREDKVLSAKQAMLLMASSAQIPLTLSTKSPRPVGMLVLITCKVGDFQIDKPRLLLRSGL